MCVQSLQIFKTIEGKRLQLQITQTKYHLCFSDRWTDQKMATAFFRQMDGLEDGHCVFRTDGRIRRWPLRFSDRWTDQKMATAFFRQMDGLKDELCVFQTD